MKKLANMLQVILGVRLEEGLGNAENPGNRKMWYLVLSGDALCSEFL